jgi:hypothetical protein
MFGQHLERGIRRKPKMSGKLLDLVTPQRSLKLIGSKRATVHF